VNRSLLLERSALGAFLTALAVVANVSSVAACEKSHAAGQTPACSPSAATCPGGGAQPVGEPDVAGLSSTVTPADAPTPARGRMAHGLEMEPRLSEARSTAHVSKWHRPHEIADRGSHPAPARVEHPAGPGDETPPPAAAPHAPAPRPGPAPSRTIPSPHRMPDPNLL